MQFSFRVFLQCSPAFELLSCYLTPNCFTWWLAPNSTGQRYLLGEAARATARKYERAGLSETRTERVSIFSRTLRLHASQQ